MRTDWVTNRATPLSRLYARLKSDGIMIVTRHLKRKLQIVRRFIILHCTLPANTSDKRPEEALAFDWAAADDLTRLIDPALDFRRDDLPKAKQRLLRGDRCIVGWIGDHPVTYAWITFSVRQLSVASLPIGSGKAFLYKTFTHPEHRGKGLNTATLSYVLKWCSDAGIREVFIDIHARNFASLAVAGKVGFQKCGAYYVFRFGSLAFAWIPKRLRGTVSS